MAFLLDAHCHSAVPPRGVAKVFYNCAVPDDWPVARSGSLADKRVFPFFGIHPWFASKAVAGWDGLLREFLSEGPAGVGEIGLDWLHKKSAFSDQVSVFSRQVRIADELERPFTVHCLGAWEELLDILSSRPRGKPFLMHAFSGNARTLDKLLAKGAFISFRAIDAANKNKRKLVEAVPLERLLLETDFPYLPGVKPAEAAVETQALRLEALYETAAGIKRLPRSELETAIRENSLNFLS